MTEAGEAAEPRARSRTRLIGARVLTVLAILLALVGMVAFYVENTALDPDGFETISRNMIENDEIRTQVAAKSVDTLFENVDVEAAIAERLPPAQQGLAPVLAGLARSGADRAADAALERPRVQTVWVEVTTRTQRQLVRLLGRRHDLHPDRGRRGRARPAPDRDPDRRPGRGHREGRREAAGVLGTDRDHRREPARDGTVDHEDPACRRGLDVARRACGRRVRDLAGARSPQARTPCARDRRARRGTPHAHCPPLRRRLPGRPAREGRRGQAGRPRSLEHPYADPRRPCLGVDHPRRHHARRSLVRRRHPSSAQARRAAAPGLSRAA